MLKFLLCPNFIKIKQKLWPVAVLTDTHTENSEPLTKKYLTKLNNNNYKK